MLNENSRKVNDFSVFTPHPPAKNKSTSAALGVYRSLPMDVVLQANGIEVRSNRKTPCPSPLHKEKIPSCHVYENHCYCFGCQTTWNAIDITIEIQKVPFWKSIRFLSEKFNLPLPRQDPKTEETYAIQQRISQVYEHVFQLSLEETEKAVEYSVKRGISADLVKGKIGYLSNIDYRPHLYEMVGLAWWESFYFFPFVNRYLIPIRLHGKIVSFQARASNPEVKKERKYIRPWAIDPPMPESLFGFDEYKGEEKVYLTEGPFDALTLQTHGYPAMGLCGTQSLSPNLIRLLKKTKIKRVILVFDNDPNGSGQKAVLETGKKLFAAGLEVQIVTLP